MIIRRQVTIDDQPKSPLKAETGERNASFAFRPDAQTPPQGMPVEVFGAGYLLTGTTLAILGQLLTNQVLILASYG